MGLQMEEGIAQTELPIIMLTPTFIIGACALSCEAATTERRLGCNIGKVTD